VFCHDLKTTTSNNPFCLLPGPAIPVCYFKNSEVRSRWQRGKDPKREIDQSKKKKHWAYIPRFVGDGDDRQPQTDAAAAADDRSAGTPATPTHPNRAATAQGSLNLQRERMQRPISTSVCLSVSSGLYTVPHDLQEGGSTDWWNRRGSLD